MSSLKKTIIYKIDPVKPDPKIIRYSARVLREGGLVAFPTETVYGLAANLFDRRALAKLYRVKARPGNKPFTVHVSDGRIVRKLGTNITAQAKLLMGRYWPGPLTIIMKDRRGKKIGFRMPDNKTALELIRLSRVPVVASSANISGKTPPRSGRDVSGSLAGKIDIILDAGKTDIGVESTVVDLTISPPRILREGAISKEDIFKTIKQTKKP